MSDKSGKLTFNYADKKFLSRARLAWQTCKVEKARRMSVTTKNRITPSTKFPRAKARKFEDENICSDSILIVAFAPSWSYLWRNRRTFSGDVLPENFTSWFHILRFFTCGTDTHTNWWNQTSIQLPFGFLLIFAESVGAVWGMVLSLLVRWWI